ncbi:MAG: nucleotide sugar dehydrogenase [Vampirovibrionales bacterium]
MSLLQSISSYEQLLSDVEGKTATVAVVGLGYVGLPLAMTLAQKKFNVIGFDLSEKKIASLQCGSSYIGDVNETQLSEALNSNQFIPTSDPEQLTKAQVFIICVPTPLDNYLHPDMKYVQGASQLVMKFAPKGSLIVLESTTYPGTTEEFIVAPLEQQGAVVGRDYFVGYSPERIDPCNATFQTHNTPKVVAGHTPQCLEVMQRLYASFIEQIHPVSSLRVAEFTKLYENTFRSVNIALVNEMAQLCQVLDIDTWEALDAAFTKPFGIMPFYPGPGVGGHCIPIDPLYLNYKLKEHSMSSQMISVATTINNTMPNYIVERVQALLNEHSKALKASKVLVLGVSYKKNTPDWRESPAQKIVAELHRKGAMIQYYDPYAPYFEDEHGNSYDSVKEADLNEAFLKQMDVAVLLTDHDLMPLELLTQLELPVLDTRNAFRKNVPLREMPSNEITPL